MSGDIPQTFCVFIGMVDLHKKIYNTNKFREAAIAFETTGKYCQYPAGTTEYYEFWDRESERAVNGYTADDGDYITGYHYFYLNYCPIQRIVNKEVTIGGKKTIKRFRELAFPEFWDYDYYYFLAIQECEETGKHLAVLKSRRKGFSYKGGSMLDRNFYLVPGSKSYVYASNKQYLSQDGILTKAWEYMDFIDTHTAWAKKRQGINTSMHRRASYYSTDEFGNKVELGYKSEVMGVSLKDNPHALRGKAAKLILFEEGGTFANLETAWRVAEPSVEQDGVVFGLMIVWGTGGDSGSSFAALKKIFYKPKSFNCLEFDNIWDENVTSAKCGFFVPQYTNLDVQDENGKRLYMDADGNTFKREALEYILSERKKVFDTATDSASVDKYVAERPITPAEAMLEFNGNIFPKRELQKQLSRIQTDRKLADAKQVGDLIFSEVGELVWVPKKHGDIIRYPIEKADDKSGSIVIWEHPVKDAPVGLYIGGTDPYDFDNAETSSSLGSTIIYKRFQSFEEYYDVIVAEYTGRPNSAEEYYEGVRRLLMYYNARLLYENERKGLYSYFMHKHCDYLLAEQPDILNDVIANSKVQRRKGCHLNKQIKQWAEGLVKDWLNEEYEPGKKNLTRIYSKPLLEELIAYNNTGNFDRVCALFQVMIYKEQLYNLVVKEKEKSIKTRMLFDGPIFTDDWFN